MNNSKSPKSVSAPAATTHPPQRVIKHLSNSKISLENASEGRNRAISLSSRAQSILSSIANSIKTAPVASAVSPKQRKNTSPPKQTKSSMLLQARSASSRALSPSDEASVHSSTTSVSESRTSTLESIPERQKLNVPSPKTQSTTTSATSGISKPIKQDQTNQPGAKLSFRSRSMNSIASMISDTISVSSRGTTSSKQSATKTSQPASNSTSPKAVINSTSSDAKYLERSGSSKNITSQPLSTDTKLSLDRSKNLKTSVTSPAAKATTTPNKAATNPTSKSPSATTSPKVVSESSGFLLAAPSHPPKSPPAQIITKNKTPLHVRQPLTAANLESLDSFDNNATSQVGKEHSVTNASSSDRIKLTKTKSSGSVSSLTSSNLRRFDSTPKSSINNTSTPATTTSMKKTKPKKLTLTAENLDSIGMRYDEDVNVAMNIRGRAGSLASSRHSVSSRSSEKFGLEPSLVHEVDMTGLYTDAYVNASVANVVGADFRPSDVLSRPQSAGQSRDASPEKSPKPPAKTAPVVLKSALKTTSKYSTITIQEIRDEDDAWLDELLKEPTDDSTPQGGPMDTYQLLCHVQKRLEKYLRGLEGIHDNVSPASDSQSLSNTLKSTESVSGKQTKVKFIRIPVQQDIYTMIEYAGNNMVSELMTALADKDYDLDRACSREGLNALCTAASKGALDTIKYLIKEGASPTFCFENGVTALYLAAKFGYLECCKYLIDKGAGFYTDDLNQALMYAVRGSEILPSCTAKQCNDKVVKLLLARGANPNYTDPVQENTTPLLEAVKLYYKDPTNKWAVNLAKTLLAAGADMHKITYTGQSALGYAVAKRSHVHSSKLKAHSAMIELFEQHREVKRK